MGRKPGVPNKFSAEAKECLALAFEGLGGVEGLVQWGKKHRAAFYRIWSKLIASGQGMGGGGSIAVSTTVNVGGADVDSRALTHAQLLEMTDDALMKLALEGSIGADQILLRLASQDDLPAIEHTPDTEVSPAVTAAPGAPGEATRP